MSIYLLITNIEGLLKNNTDKQLGNLFDMNGKEARKEILALKAKGHIYLPSENCKHFDPKEGCKCRYFEKEQQTDNGEAH
jgi:hypothetical protein